MLDRIFNSLTVNGPCDLTTKNIYQGSPLQVGTDGKYKLCSASAKPRGLSFNYYSSEKDDVNGGEWFANSQQLGVVKVAQVSLQPDVFIAADGSQTKVYPWDQTKTYAFNDVLYVNSSGKLTNVVGTAGLEVGVVDVAPTATDDKMIVTINLK